MESKLSVEGITAGLGTQIIGQQVIYIDRLPSTMEAARQKVKLGAVEGTTVVAGEQTAGRGRLKRAWLSPEGSIALSVVLYPEISLLPSLVMLASLAVVRSIEHITSLKAGIKWPNDVLINGRKVCGILVENNIRGNTVEYAVIGIGLNVNFSPDEFPEISGTATSLARETGQSVSRLALIRRLLVELDSLYTAVQSGVSLFEAWRDNLITLGQNVRASCGEIVYEGIAESVGRDGGLWLRQPDGSLIKIMAGDVTLSH